ncbi:MAG: serine/threonine protein kinase [Chitinophagaceae bacterium]|nr:serine/threonine protein kinase [Chitinophagaceae bacterium]
MRYDSGHITEIAGYRLTVRLGSGGMGDVYKAYNAALNRTAAIKILHQKEMGDRFRNEAYIQSSVTHPNIARLYEYLVTGETACIIMEFVEGDPLDVHLHRKGKLSNEETENIIKQIAAALAYLHSKDILHRDIKPQNFKVQPNGTITMLDFGIAKNKYTPKLTQQGYMVGTTEYMAPEQFRQQVEKKSDIWSLGVMAYELITGHMPFGADNAVAMRFKIEKGDYTKPRVLVPAVSAKLHTVIEKCLQVNTSNRLSAAEVEMLLSDKKPEPAAENKTTAPVQLKLNRKTGIIAACIALIIIIVLIIPAGSGKKAGGESLSGENDNTLQQTSEIQKLTIDVNNASNAYIVFPDGTTEKLPFAISGKEGENFQFTLQAEGYESKKVDVGITIGRKSYEYNLEKIKE